MKLRALGGSISGLLNEEGIWSAARCCKRARAFYDVVLVCARS